MHAVVYGFFQVQLLKKHKIIKITKPLQDFYSIHVPSLFPGCQGGRGRGGNDDGNDGGVYRYDYDDLDIRPTSSSTTPGGIGRNRFVCLFIS